MPNGKFHQSIITALAPAVFPISLLAFRDKPVIAITFCCGILLGVFVSPDLDIPRMTQPKKAMGYFSYLWHLFWLPYAKLITQGHRSFLSHSPLIGTLVRFLYLIAPIYLVLLFGFEKDISVYASIFVPLFCGLCIADLVHIILDAFWRN